MANCVRRCVAWCEVVSKHAVVTKSPFHVVPQADNTKAVGHFKANDIVQSLDLGYGRNKEA